MPIKKKNKKRTSTLWEELRQRKIANKAKIRLLNLKYSDFFLEISTHLRKVITNKVKNTNNDKIPLSANIVSKYEESVDSSLIPPILSW